jgi:hypothetical protein
MFIVCVVLCAVFRMIVVLFCFMCVIGVLCLTVVPLPPGESSFSVKISNIIYKLFSFLDLSTRKKMEWTTIPLETSTVTELHYSVHITGQLQCLYYSEKLLYRLMIVWGNDSSEVTFREWTLSANGKAQWSRFPLHHITIEVQSTAHSNCTIQAVP